MQRRFQVEGARERLADVEQRGEAPGFACVAVRGFRFHEAQRRSFNVGAELDRCRGRACSALVANLQNRRLTPPMVHHCGGGIIFRIDGSPRPLRAVADRLPARRRRPHGALQLALRAPARRRLRAAHRGHRRRAIVGRDGRRASSTACAGSASTGTRGRSSADRTRRTFSPSGSIGTARWRERLVADGRAYYCYCTHRRDQSEARRRRIQPARRGATTAPAAR